MPWSLNSRQMQAWLYEEPVPPMPGAATALAATQAGKAAGAAGPLKLGKGVRRAPLE